MYKPEDIKDSPRLSGIRTIMRPPYVNRAENVVFAIVGVRFDTGQSYRTGARLESSYIRELSSMLLTYNSVQEIDIFEYIFGIDYWDLAVIPGNISRT